MTRRFALSATALSPTPILDGEETSNNVSEWRLAKRIAFRFAFTYLALYNFPFPVGALPWTDGLAAKYELIWKVVVPWAGSHVFHIKSPISTTSTGSGAASGRQDLEVCRRLQVLDLCCCKEGAGLIREGTVESLKAGGATEARREPWQSARFPTFAVKESVHRLGYRCTILSTS